MIQTETAKQQWLKMTEKGYRRSQSDKLVDGFEEMLPVFTRDDICEVFYDRCGDNLNTVFY